MGFGETQRGDAYPTRTGRFSSSESSRAVVEVTRGSGTQSSTSSSISCRESQSAPAPR